MFSKQRIKTLIDPNKPQVQQMIKSYLTPAHSSSLEALLNESVNICYEILNKQK